jgi:hypothetical protein
MQALETESLKRYEKILKMKKQIEEEEENAIEKDEEPTHKEQKEKLYENDVYGIVFITSNKLNFNPLFLKKKHKLHEFV